jgi:hypothetical protein
VATIHVASTSGFPDIGTIIVASSGADQTIAYTGITGGVTPEFTGCTGGSSGVTFATGGSVVCSAMPAGQVLGYGLTQYPGRTGWVVIGTTLYGFDNENGGGVFAYTGSFQQTPTAKVVGIQSGPTFLYLTSQGDTTYVANINTGTLEPMLNAPGGSVIGIYNTRLVVANLGGVNTNRVAFSDPYSPGAAATQFAWDADGAAVDTTIAAGSDGDSLPQNIIYAADTSQFPTSGTMSVTTTAGGETVTYTSITGGSTPSFNGCVGGTGTMATGGVISAPTLTYFDLADAWDVNALAIQRTHMLIGKDNGWYLYQGEPGLNASLRIALDQTPGPKDPAHCLVTQTGLIWYIPLFHDTPTEFTGTAIAQMRHLHVDGDVYEESVFPAAPIYGGAPMGQTTDFQFVSSSAAGTPNFGVGMHNGAWFYHQYGVDISGYVAHAVDRFYFCDGGGTSSQAQFYILLTDLDRPVLSTDNLASFGDDTATPLPCHIELPEWESRDGSEAIIRAVEVSFQKWDTGSAQTNHFEMTVVSTSQFNKTAVPGGVLDVPAGQYSVTQSWDEDPSLTMAPGQYQHHVFRVADQKTGNGFKISLDNLRGVAIRKIQVILDIQETRT